MATTAEDIIGLNTLAPPRLEYKSNSEPELRGRPSLAAGGFPPGLTVDELVLYRRRRPPCHLRPQDNLHPEPGTLKSIKSEYRRRFLSYPFHDKENALRFHRRRSRQPGDGIKFDGDIALKAEYSDRFVDFPRQRPVINRRPRTSLAPPKDIRMETKTEKSENFVEISPVAQRPPLARKSTTLRYEGEILVTQSELHSKYVPFQGAKRAELARRPTTLKMEGEMNTVTEKKEKFVRYSSPSRTPIMRHKGNLKLEGEMDTTTESNSKFVKHSSPRRAQPRRRNTNLCLDGDLEMKTESNTKYIEFGPRKRPELLKRLTNLQLEGEIEYIPEYKSICVDYPRERPVVKRPTNNLKIEGEFENITEKNSQFIDFSSQTKRPNFQKRAENLKLEGNLISKAEYKESFIDFPRERPKVKKQEGNLKMEGDIEQITEKKASFVDFPPNVRSTAAKQKQQRPPATTTSSSTTTTTTTTMTTVPPLSTPTPSKKQGKQEQSQSGGDKSATSEYKPSLLEQAGRRRPYKQLDANTNANAQVFRAFQVLDTQKPEKVVTFDLIGPRPRTRSVSQCSKDLASLRDPVPAIHMQVSDIDNNANRRHRRSCSPSPRSSSPSYLLDADNNNQAFVILQDDTNANKIPRSNLLDIPRGKGMLRRTDQHVRWMPPWYDAPTSI